MRKLTQEHKKALLLYLKALRPRFAELAETGKTRKGCVLCRAARLQRGGQWGGLCTYCPVFSPSAMCDEYLPAYPAGLSLSDCSGLAVDTKARAWAARVVAILDDVERTAER